MKKIYIDLSRLNPEYAGGVSRFSIGLTNTILLNRGYYNVTLIASNINYSFIKSTFKNSDIIIYKYSYIHKGLLALISLLSYFTSFPSLLLLMDFFSPTPVELKKPNVLVICPTSTLNFYNKKVNSLLCIHDIQHELYPENFTFLVRAVRWAKYRLSSRLSKWIQVSSNAIKMDIINQFGTSIGKKIFIAYEGFDPKLFSIGLPDKKPQQIITLMEKRFVYYPAQLWKHKNHKIVIEGLSIFNRSTLSPISLILTGKDYGELSNILSLARSQDLDIFHLGIIPEIEMRWLYRNSICSIAAGYHESSSLPIREAIASGGNVLASDIAPNMEIKTLRGLYLFETFSPVSFASQLKFLLKEGSSIAPIKQKNSHFTIDDFSWSKIVDAYYRPILDKSMDI